MRDTVAISSAVDERGIAGGFSSEALGVNVALRMTERILLVDDDEALLDVLPMALEDAGFRVATARNGRDGFRLFREGPPDLVILDVLMPEVDGLELLRMIRREHAVPVVILTSRDEDLDQVLGLDMGADDYITKPFSTKVLIARLRAVLRRHSERSAEERLEAGTLVLDRGRREVTAGGSPVTVTATEFELLFCLVDARGRVLSRDDLIDRVYGADIVVSERTIDTFVKRLRRKIRDVDPTFDAIETVRSVGYRYAP
jgi:DNA-binding response OmpR family regulator